MKPRGWPCSKVPLRSMAKARQQARRAHQYLRLYAYGPCQHCGAYHLSSMSPAEFAVLASARAWEARA